MRNFTAEEMERLRPLEEHLNTAYKLGFKRSTPISDNDIVADILEAASGQKYARNWNCSHCLYKVWSDAGKNYFETLAALKKSDEPKPSISDRMKAYWAKKKQEKNGEEK